MISAATPKLCTLDDFPFYNPLCAGLIFYTKTMRKIIIVFRWKIKTGHKSAFDWNDVFTSAPALAVPLYHIFKNKNYLIWRGQDQGSFWQSTHVHSTPALKQIPKVERVYPRWNSTTVRVSIGVPRVEFIKCKRLTEISIRFTKCSDRIGNLSVLNSLSIVFHHDFVVIRSKNEKVKLVNTCQGKWIWRVIHP